jgi:acyl-CoA synthetase (AMP-forming)/AMP-acid ligase II
VPVPEIQLRIIADRWGTPLGPVTDDEFAALAVDAGQAGEIIVSGNHVLRGYLGGIGDGETKIHVNGHVWHRTGDAGWMDPLGRVWLLGRCVEKLPGDAFCYPFAIECALREFFPKIRIAALEWNGRRTLVIGKRCGDDEAAAIRSSAAEFGIKNVIFLSAIPLDRRHNAKIDYPALRGLLGA